MTKASVRNASHYFATDSDREAFLALFGNRLDVWFTPEFAAYVRTGQPVHERRIPDVGCPKCGHDNVSIRHCFGGEGSFMPDDRCRLGDPQHFHRHCGRCSYRWRTNETPMDAKEETAP